MSKKVSCLYVVCVLPLLSIGAVGDPENARGMSKSEQELLGKYLLQRLLGKSVERNTDPLTRIAERADRVFDDLLSSASVVYPEYETDADSVDVDFQYSDTNEEVSELKQPSQTIATIVPAPSNLKTDHKYCTDCNTAGKPTKSKFSMPLTTLGVKKYYIGIFFKANWARSAQYCRYHGMHLASINTEEEQKKLEDHIQSLGFGHEHFWTSGTDQAEEGKFFWMATGKPLTYENWNIGEPNNYEYEGGEREHCLELWNRDGKGLKWNDTPCSFETFFICEV